MASTSLPPANSTRRILAKALSDRLGYGGNEDCITFIRCNGREFQIEMSPSFICISPVVESRYRNFIAAVKDDEEYDPTAPDPEIVVADFHEWLIAVFEPLFLELAPDVPPSFDPAKLRTGEVRPLLLDYLFIERHGCRLEVENEKAFPVHSRDEEKLLSPIFNRSLHPGLVQELRQHVKYFDPSSVEVSFRKPKYALSREPTRVLVELDDSSQKTACFFESFADHYYEGLDNELELHLDLLKSDLASDARVARLRGVVVAEDGGVAGLLLTYVPRGKGDSGLWTRAYQTPIILRQRWAMQIQETVAQLHHAGLVWGNSMQYNVVVDENNDAWLLGFGRHYTEGLVDEDKVGTKEGDLQWAAKIVEHLSNAPYEPYDGSEWDSGEDW